MNSVKVKILICYHRPFQLIKDEILTPIHAGRAIAEFFPRINVSLVEFI